MLKVAHVTVITPRRCGLYETTRDLVAGLRRQGVDARIVDPTPDENPVFKDPAALIAGSDRGVPFAGIDWALGADVISSHSGYAYTAIDRTDQPVVHVVHGRPLVSYLSEVQGRGSLYTYHATLDRQPRVKAVVTFWEQHVPYHQVMFANTPVYHVPSMVDLEYWNADPDPDPYRWGFAGAGTFNAVITDGWRDDVDPFNAMCAWALWARGREGHPKLHLYGKPMPAPGTDAIIERLIRDGTMGEFRPWVPQAQLRAVFKQADCLITPHQIDTRAVREAMACGCPVVRVGNDLGFQLPTSARADVRRLAEQLFDPERSAAQFLAILESVAR